MNEYRVWRINLQIITMQMNEYKMPSSEDQRTEWKQKIAQTLFKINQIAQGFMPQELPTDLVCPIPLESLAPTATMENWCQIVTQQLADLFCNAPAVPTMKIDQIYTV